MSIKLKVCVTLHSACTLTLQKVNPDIFYVQVSQFSVEYLGSKEHTTKLS